MRGVDPTLTLGSPGERRPDIAPTLWPHVGVQIGGRFTPIESIGAGGMGAVWKVHDAHLDEVVALKLLRPDLTHDADAVARFRQEVRLARQVTHPNVVRTFDLGECVDTWGQRRWYLTMAWVPGRSLAALLRDEAPLHPHRAARLFVQVCHALQAAHDVGVLHRDLKPDNILVGPDDRALLTDFGIARAAGGGATGTGIVGTPAYMAPEQLGGGASLDARTDLYAATLVLFEMLCGARPFPAASPLEAALSRLQQSPPDPRVLRPQLPEGVSALIQRGLDRDPTRRHRSASELAAETVSALGGGPPAFADAPLSPSPRVEASVVPTDPRWSAPTQRPSQFTPTPAVPGAQAFLPRETPVPSPFPSAAPMPQPTPWPQTVAVLPFRVGGGTDDLWLAEGLSEEIIDGLSMAPGLRVRPFSSVVHLAPNDALALGRDLGVAVVVEGTIRRTGPALRITARLLDVADGFQRWARRWDAAPAEALRIADEAAAAIAEALTSSVERAPRSEHDPIFIEWLLRGRRALREGWDASLDTAVHCFQQALAHQRDEPEALALLATALARDTFLHGNAARSAEQARESASRAVQLGPNRPETWLALAACARFAKDLPAAARALREALTLAPGNVDAQATLGALLAESGPLPDAIARLELACSIDPSIPIPRVDLARCLALAGRWSEVEAPLRHAVFTLGSYHAWLNWARFSLWDEHLPVPPRVPDPPPAEPSYRRVLRLLTNGLLDLRAGIGAAAGPTIEVLREGGKDGGRLELACWQVEAEVRMHLGEQGAGLYAVGRAVDAGLADALWMARCPLLFPLRSDARWPALSADVDRRAHAVAATVAPTLSGRT